MSNNITTTREDVNVTVTESLNESIFKSLSRIERNLNEMMLMMEHMPMADGVNDGVKINEAWEEQIKDAVLTALRRNMKNPQGFWDAQLVIDTVIAILRGHNED